MTRRFRHPAHLLLAAAFLLAGCGQPGGRTSGDESAQPGRNSDVATAPEKATTTIVLAHPYIGAAAEAIAGAAAMFDESRPDVTVQLRPTAVEDILFSIPHDIRAGKGPDVFIAPDTFARHWATLDNILQPLDVLLKTTDAVPGSQPASGQAGAGAATGSRLSPDGRPYGLALAVRVPMLVANDDFLGAEFKFTPGDDSRPTAVSVVANDWLALTGFATAGGGQIIDGTGRAAFDDPAAATGMVALAGLLESGAIRPERSRQAIIDAFNDSGIAAMITWPDSISLISSSISWRIVPFPEIEGVGRPQPWWQIDSIFVSSWSRHRRQAADLATWLASPTAADYLMRHDFPGLAGRDGGMINPAQGDQAALQYAALPVNRGILTQRAAAIPSPDLPATATAATFFARLATDLAASPANAAKGAGAAVEKAARDARDAVTKVMQSSSFRLK
ncbi:MAG TPA: hypothetical protein PKG82_03065 [Myxococcota bacterium]|nr:hypothetical protein [Myxococcota bacterium]